MSFINAVKKHIRIEDAIGVGTWFFVFFITLRMMPNADPVIQNNQPFIILGFLGYLICFIGATRTFNNRLTIIHQRVLFTFMLLFSFFIMSLIPLDFLPILTIVWAAVSLHYLSPAKAFLTTSIAVLAWFTIYAVIWEQRAAFYSGLLYYAFHMFALMTSLQVIKAQQASDKAKALNVELVAAKELLAESTKQQERTRIARELHDLLGHHLTALNINLQVANHLTEKYDSPEDLKQPISQSYFLAKLLLSDVREAVSVIRENQHIDIAKAIKGIESSFPKLTINVTGTELNIENIELLHDLLRCIQEAVTNAVKHGNASVVNICLISTDSTIEVEITDNGNGYANRSRYVNENQNNKQLNTTLPFGNGLTGMQERLSSYNGTATFEIIGTQVTINLNIPLLDKAEGAKNDN